MGVSVWLFVYLWQKNRKGFQFFFSGLRLVENDLSGA